MAPRRSLRARVETPTKAAVPKRQAPASTPRSSKRRKTTEPTASKSTPRKSQYFSPSQEQEQEQVQDEGEDELAMPNADVDSESEDDESNDDASAYGDASDAEAEISADGDEDEDLEDEDEETPPPKRKGKGRASIVGRGSTHSTLAKGQELWRTGVKTGLAPGEEVIIAKPKARSAGKVPYKNEQIHPNTMLFLGDLAKNNDREWLKRNDPDYRTSWDDFVKWTECLQEKIIEYDETVPELPMKDVFFRIYRDVRFSKDPTPYKDHFSAAWSRTGRKGPFAAYYIQIKPGGSFVGGGLWMPEAQNLAALRRNIDRRPHQIKSVLMNEEIRKELLGNIAPDESRVVRAFTAQNSGNALKTKPKGFDADHENIDLLRLRNFTIGAKLRDEEVLGKQGLHNVAVKMKALVPFVTYLNSIVMPDEPWESDDASSSGAEDDENGAEDDGTE